MNVLFFLTPKNKVAYISDKATVRQALEKMEHHGYTAIPILDDEGRYRGTITEGDLLWYIKDNYDMSLKDAEEDSIQALTRQNRIAESVNLNSQLEDLIHIVLRQNFVPVTTEDGIFMGIVTRKTVIDYFYKNWKKNA